MTPSRLHFLVFAPRSGSTLVARSLSDAHPALLVLPEFRTVEFLLARSEHAVRRLSPRALQRILLADRQLAPNLGIGPERAVELAHEHAGRGTLDILAGLVSCYALADSASPDIIVKLGTAAGFLPRLHEVSPNGVVIHVCRDGRAAVSSLLATPRAYFRGETMGRGDVVHCCRVWARHQRTLRDAARDTYPIVTVQYEEFLQSPEQISQRVIHRLGLVPAGSPTRTTSARPFSVSALEQMLHPLAADRPAASRRDGWRQELPREAQVFADWRLHDELVRLGYTEPLAPIASRRELLRCVALGYSWHVVALLRYLARRSTTVVRSPGAVVEHLNARVASSAMRRRHLP